MKPCEQETVTDIQEKRLTKLENHFCIDLMKHEIMVLPRRGAHPPTTDKDQLQNQTDFGEAQSAQDEASNKKTTHSCAPRAAH